MDGKLVGRWKNMLGKQKSDPQREYFGSQWA